MAQAVLEKETKAQKAERLKREKNPWNAFDEVARVCSRRPLQRCARAGPPPTSSGGASTPRATGSAPLAARGGEGVTSDYFMMRIGIPNGVLSASQLRTIGGITRK